MIFNMHGDGVRSANASIGVNCNFINPVNQRSIVSGTAYTYSTPTYWLDCWKLNGNGMWTAGSGVTLSANAENMQYFEVDYRELLGETYTVGLAIGDQVKKVTLAWPSSVSGATVSDSATLTGICTVELGFAYRAGATKIGGIDQNYVPYLKITALAETTCKAVKIERGSSSTLDMECVVDFASELARCYRYYYEQVGLKFVGIDKTWLSPIMSFPVPMRIVPTSNLVSGKQLRYSSGSTQTTAVIGAGIGVESVKTLAISPALANSLSTVFEETLTFSAEL